MSFFFYGFALISLGWLCRGAFSLFRWFQARRYTGSTQGKVIHYRPNFRWSGQFVATIEYAAEENCYRQPWIPLPYQEELQEGKPVNLLYDPQNPRHFALADYDVLRRRGLMWLFFAICYLALALAYDLL